jgi:hypothetical protein
MTLWFLNLVAIDAPVLVGMASFAVIFIVIGLAAVFENPARIFVFYPPFLMIEGHAIFFNVLMANITGDFIFTSFFVAWHTIAVHIGQKVCCNRITFPDTAVALITFNLIFEMYLMSKLQISVLFRDIMFYFYFHPWSRVAQ